MYKTPSHLPEAARTTVIQPLNEILADGLDLHSQLKVAHWNVRGPQFPTLHPLFEQFAIQLATHNDAIAERAVTLGGLASGTTRGVAKRSRIEEYPVETMRDIDHVSLLADRFDAFLTAGREARARTEKVGDTDSVDLLTGVITDFEKNAWFLRATLA